MSIRGTSTMPQWQKWPNLVAKFVELPYYHTSFQNKPETVMPFPEKEVDGGVRRQVLADHPTMMVVAFRFETGMEGALHAHPHVQSTFVRSGSFRFSINGEKRTVSAGDSFVIPSQAEHGCVCLEDGELIDCFTPRRDDFL